MLWFLVRKLLSVLGVAIAASAIVGAFLRALRPEAYRDDRALAVQVADHVWGAFTRLDLGTSSLPPHPPVRQAIFEDLPADLSVLVGALVVGFALGWLGGVVCARNPGGLADRILQFVALLAVCAPVYWVGLVLILLFATNVGGIAESRLFDPGIYRPLTEDPATWLQSLIIPWLVCAAPLAGACLRLTRAALLDLGEQDYLRTALGKGLGSWRISTRHAAPPATAPVVALTGAYTTLMIGNVVLVEQVFNVPGSFREIPSLISNGDLAYMEGLVIVGAVLVVLANLLADLVVAWLDPRTRRAS